MLKRPLIIKLITIALALATIIIWHRLYKAFDPETLYQKDFIQFYLMAEAAASGLPVYGPIGDLARTFDLHPSQYTPHASAYPPTVLLLARPLAALSYTHALIVWNLMEIICFVIAAILIVRKLRGPNRLIPVIVTCMLWPPFYYDLYQGQVMMLILLLLTLTWLSLSSGRDKAGGIFLGFLFALKLYAWPVGIFLILKRRHQPVLWAIGIFLLLHFIVAAWLGFDTLTQYYLRVAPSIQLTYQSHPLNFSLFSQGADLIGRWFGVLLVILVLAFSLVLALRAPDFDHSFMILVAATIILTPVSWAHYMITLVPAICLVASWKEFQGREKVLIVIVLYLAFPEIYERFMPLSVIRVIPVLFVFGVMLLLSRVLRRVGDASRSAANMSLGSGISVGPGQYRPR